MSEAVLRANIAAAVAEAIRERPTFDVDTLVGIAEALDVDPSSLWRPSFPGPTVDAYVSGVLDGFSHLDSNSENYAAGEVRDAYQSGYDHDVERQAEDRKDTMRALRKASREGRKTGANR